MQSVSSTGATEPPASAGTGTTQTQRVARAMEAQRKGKGRKAREGKAATDRAKKMQRSCEGHGMHRPCPSTHPQTPGDEGARERMLCDRRNSLRLYFSRMDLLPALL